MTTTGTFPSFGIFFAIHGFAMLLLSIGIIFLIVWAIKTLTAAQLKTWGMGIAAVGLLLCLLTLPAMKHIPWGDRDGTSCKMMNDATSREENGDAMIMDEEGDDMDMGNMMMKNGMMDHSMMNDAEDGMAMSMDDMSKMLEGKTGDAFDAAFLEMMIPHHQGAVDMANAVLKSAKHTELKTMANAIITSQQKEIDMMKQWQKDWGYTK